MLRWDDALASAARRHAALMAQHGALSHQYLDEPPLLQRISATGARFSSVAENIASGQDTGDIHSGWMRSPGHRANILDPKLTALGVAVVQARGRVFAVEDFSLAVANLNLEEQERTVSALIQEQGIRFAKPTPEARKECATEGTPAGNHPMFIVRYEAPDISKLPDLLEKKIQSQAYQRAEVGACQPEKESRAPVYRIAVLLF